MNTTGMFSRSTDDVDVGRPRPTRAGSVHPEERSPRAPGPGPVSESTAVVSTVPGASSSSGTAEEEMRASLAATTRAMDRVTAAAAAAEYNLQAASLLASRDTGTPGGVGAARAQTAGRHPRRAREAGGGAGRRGGGGSEGGCRAPTPARLHPPI